MSSVACAAVNTSMPFTECRMSPAATLPLSMDPGFRLSTTTFRASVYDVRPMPTFVPLALFRWTTGIDSRGWSCGLHLLLALRFFSMLFLCECCTVVACWCLLEFALLVLAGAIVFACVALLAFEGWCA